MGWTRLVWLSLLGGCLQANVVICGDAVCPAGTMCYAVANGNLCIRPEQLASCEGQAENAECDAGEGLPGLCHDGLCSLTYCGDGFVSGNEECEGQDLGSKATCKDIGFYEPTALACTAHCTYDVDACASAGRCGDGVLQSEHELCEGVWPHGGCIDFGFDAGRVACNLCGASFQACTSIGWKLAGDFTLDAITQLWGHGPADVWAATRPQSSTGSKLFHFTEGTWVRAAENLTLGMIEGLWGSAADDVWAISSIGQLFHYNGVEWARDQMLGSGGYRDLWGNAANDIWVVGDTPGLPDVETAATIVHFDGTTWSPLPNAPRLAGIEDLLAVTGSGSSIWAVGTDAVMLHYDGTTWREARTVSARTPLRAVWASSPTDAWAVGDDGVVVRFVNGTWSPPLDLSTLLPSGVDLEAVWGSGPKDVWAAGDAGTIIHFDGINWSLVRSDVTDTLYAGWGASSRHHLVGGDFGALRSSSNSSWQPANIATGAIPASLAINDVWFATPRLGWAVASSSSDPGPVIEFDGRQWTAETDATVASGPWKAIWGKLVSANPLDLRIWVVGGSGAGGVIAHYNTAVNSWEVDATPTTPLKDVWGSSGTDVWAVGSGIVLHRDSTGWSTVDVGVNVTFDGVHGTAPDDVWIVGRGLVTGMPGTIVHYDGTTWTRHIAPTTDHLTAVVAFARDDVWAVGDRGSIIHWDGSSWSVVPSPTELALNDIGGTAPNDIFAVGAAKTVIHYDGAWSEVVDPPGTITPHGLNAVFADARHVTFVGTGPYMIRLERAVPWTCAAAETACSDRVDDDCDGKIDNCP